MKGNRFKLICISLFFLSKLFANEEVYKLEHTKSSDINKSIESVMLFSSALTAANFAASCYNSLSAVTYSLGATLYLAAEYKNWNDYKTKKESKEEMVVKKGVDELTQIEHFQSAQSVSMDAKVAIENKKRNAKAFATAVTLAGIIAAYESSFPLSTTSYTCQGLLSKNEYQFFLKTIQYASRLISSNSNAGNDPASFGIAGIATALVASNKINSTIGAYAPGRIGMFAAISAMAFTTANQAGKIADAYQENIDKYQKIINALMQNISPNIDIVDNHLKLPPNNYLPFNNPLTNLPVNTSNQNTSNKNTIKDPNSKNDKNKLEFPEGFNAPPIVVEGLNTISDGIRFYKNGDTQKAKTSFHKLNNNASKLRNLRSKALKRLNKYLKKNKSRPILLAKNHEKVKNDMKKAFLKDFNSLSAKQKNFLNLASINKGLPNNKKEVASVEKSNLKFNSEKAKSLKTIRPFDLTFPEDNEAQNHVSTDKNKISYKQKGDISKKSSVSIFKIITLRYFQSAYKRIFDIK